MMKLRKRSWGLIRRFEEKDRASLYKNLNSRTSYKIFTGLYELASRSLGKRYFNEIDTDKIKALTRIHAIFNKVKA
jgi:hypothetical protein